MLKPPSRIHSRYSREAIELLGSLIRQARVESRLTAEELAVRAGISRALLYRIEKGDPSCSIGAVFEVAAIVGVPLFESERARLSARLADSESRLALLPKSVRKSKAAVRDDF